MVGVMDGGRSGNMKTASSNTTVVLTNWKRHFNLPTIVNEFRAQTRQPKIVVVDSHLDSSPEDRMPDDTASLFDDIYRVPDNGPSSRFAGGLFADTKYVLFYDDDMIPGRSLIESIEKQACDLNDEFSTIGGVGRYVVRKRLRKANVRTTKFNPVAVDVTCRAHLILSESLSHAIHERIVATKDGLDASLLRNDDLFLSLGIQKWTGHASYIQGRQSPKSAVRLRELPAPFACNKNSDHRQSRADLLRWFFDVRNWRTKRR